MRWLLTVVAVAAWPGCASSAARPRLDLAPSTQPAEPIDVQQLAGQVVAGVKTELAARVETAVETTLAAKLEATGVRGDATGYRSEFGVGATLVVTLTLILALVLSHRREMARIRAGEAST